MQRDWGARSKLVFMYVERKGTATLEELKDRLGLTLTELYPTLSHLESEGAIERDGEAVYCA
jgi:DNA-binding IclR family transcriptional regulator